MFRVCPESVSRSLYICKYNQFSSISSSAATAESERAIPASSHSFGSQHPKVVYSGRGVGFSGGNKVSSKSIIGTCLRYDFLSIAVLPISRSTDSSLGMAPRILVTLRKSFWSLSIQFIVYIIDCILWS